MDLVNILPALESIARSINFGPLNDLLGKIRQFVDRILLVITPDAPVRDAGQAMMGYTDHFNDLVTQLGNSLPTLQDVYSGPAADTYHASARQALQLMQKTHGHLSGAVDHHGRLAEHFAESLLQQGMLVAQGAVMAVDLGSLIFTGGLDAPVSVPVAAGDAIVADGTVVAMDAAVDAADATVGAIGESTSELGDLAFDLGDEGSDALTSGDTLAGDGGLPGDPGGAPPGENTPLDPSGTGGGGGEPPGNEPPAGDDPLYNNPQQYANTRAQELQQALPEGSQGRVTMGTGVVEDSNGVRQVIIGTSENGGYLRQGVKALLNPDDIVADGALHAEQNIVQYAADNGLKVIAVGAGRNICEACEEAIVNAGGPEAVASMTRSGFIPFWMRLLGP